MSREFRTDDWDSYKMDYSDPFKPLEPLDEEIAIVDGALRSLVDIGALLHNNYDHEKLLAHRAAVAENFEIPWTAISPRMQRLLYAINAIRRPENMIAAGVFCGNTFMSNAGAGAGPGACYEPGKLIGVEIKPDEAERAERNVRKIDPSGKAYVLAADAVDVCTDFEEEIGVLYLDADGDGGRGKGIYLDILQASLDKMPMGAPVLAHNSINGGERIQPYLDWVRSPANMSASINIVFDPEGLEVSVK